MSSSSNNKNNKIRKSTESFLDKDFDTDDIQKKSPEEIKKILQELQAYQIELEIQNEELLKTQRELSEVRDQFADLYDYAPIGYLVLDLDHSIDNANLTICKMLGVSRMSLYKKGIFEFITENSRDSFCQLLQQVIEFKSKQISEMVLFKKNGNEFYTIFECAPQFNSEEDISGILITINDITERKIIENKLKESEKRFRDIAYSMADWIWELDSEGKYTYCSGKVKEVLGYAVNEVIGKTPFYFMPLEEAERIEILFKAITHHRKTIVDLENWNITKSGKKVCLLTNGVPILDNQGNLTGYRGVDKDITENKRVEEAFLNSMK